jgi:hypothetical protein
MSGPVPAYHDSGQVRSADQLTCADNGTLARMSRAPRHGRTSADAHPCCPRFCRPSHPGWTLPSPMGTSCTMSCPRRPVLGTTSALSWATAAAACTIAKRLNCSRYAVVQKAMVTVSWRHMWTCALGPCMHSYNRDGAASTAHKAAAYCSKLSCQHLHATSLQPGRCT